MDESTKDLIEVIEALRKEMKMGFDRLLPPETMNVRELARHLESKGISQAMIYGLVRINKIPFERRGKKIVFEREKIDKWAKGIDNLTLSHDETILQN